MDRSRVPSHYETQNPTRPTHSPSYSPSSPSLDEQELFLQIFDWNSYCQATQPFVPESSPSPPSSSSSYPEPTYSPPGHHLSKLITEIPSVLDNLSIGVGDSYYTTMKGPYYSEDDQPRSTSEYSSGQTPPELVRGGSTSSSDHPGSPPSDRPDDYYRNRSDVSLRDFQAQDDEWTYPQTGSPKSIPRGYPADLYVSEEQQSRILAEQQAAGLKRRRSGHDFDRRHRQLADPAHTAGVRKSGACLPCRVTKTKCHDNGVCPKCRKAFPDHSHLVCTRATPAMANPILREMPDVWSSQATQEELLYTGPQFYTGKARDISVFFSADTTMPALRATVQGYRSHDGSDHAGGLSKVDFPRDCVPSYSQLQRWVEAQIRLEHGQEFEYCVQSLLLAYHEDGHGLPKHSFVSKVHKMNCFYRILRTSRFWCRDPANNIVALPLSVQAQLRNIARKAFRSVEHDVLKDLDDCLAQQDTPKTEERLAMWASLWQLMMIYRDLLDAFKVHMTYLPDSADDFTVNRHGSQYKWLRDSFFPLIAVFYHYQFRTKKSLEIPLDWIKSSKYPRMTRDGKTIRYIANQLLDSRKVMYRELQSSDDEIDRLLCVFAVNHEIKKMNARQRSKTSSKSSKHGAGDCDDMD